MVHYAQGRMSRERKFALTRTAPAAVRCAVANGKWCEDFLMQEVRTRQQCARLCPERISDVRLASCGFAPQRPESSNGFVEGALRMVRRQNRIRGLGSGMGTACPSSSPSYSDFFGGTCSSPSVSAV